MSDILYVKKIELNFLEKLEICKDICKGMNDLQQNVPPVLHRDLKPANILIREATKEALITDFGISKLLE